MEKGSLLAPFLFFIFFFRLNLRNGMGLGQGRFKKHLYDTLSYDLIFGCSCVEPGVGLDDSCGFFLTQNIL